MYSRITLYDEKNLPQVLQDECAAKVLRDTNLGLDFRLTSEVDSCHLPAQASIKHNDATHIANGEIDFTTAQLKTTTFSTDLKATFQVDPEFDNPRLPDQHITLTLENIQQDTEQCLQELVAYCNLGVGDESRVTEAQIRLTTDDNHKRFINYKPDRLDSQVAEKSE